MALYFFRETGRFSRDTRHICTSIGLAEWQTSIFVSREWKALPRQPYDRFWAYHNSNAHDWVNFNISARFGAEKLLHSLEKRMNFALEIHAWWIPIQESASVGCDDLEIWSVFRIFIVTNGGRATVQHIQHIIYDWTGMMPLTSPCLRELHSIQGVTPQLYYEKAVCGITRRSDNHALRKRCSTERKSQFWRQLSCFLPWLSSEIVMLRHRRLDTWGRLSKTVVRRILWI